jgi:cyanophycinase
VTRTSLANNGTLALVGSGEYLPRMDPVDRLLLDRAGAPARVVCLPTAAAREGPDTVARWSRMGVEHFTRLGARAESVAVVDRRTANDEALVDRIRAASFVYLSGGKPDYLYQTLEATRAWEAIAGVLAGGGVVAGCSAGAMIFGARIPSFPTLWPFQPGFNHLPGTVIMPHYDEVGDGLKRVLKFMIGRATLVGIDGFTALVEHDGRFTAHGAGSVTVWNDSRKRFVDGQGWGGHEATP